MSDVPESLRRRRLLAGSAGAIAGAGLIGLPDRAGAQASAPAVTAARPLPAYVAWKDASALIVHTPTTIETRRSAFGTSGVTPAEQLYIPTTCRRPTRPSSPTAMPGRWPSKAFATRAR